uniref:Uncharacterized protein n=2 Tax=unclassified Mycobacterium TaxID=2642494 RepID=A0A5Q5BDY5_MYCSS
MSQRGVRLGGSGFLDPRTTGGPTHAGRVGLVTARRLGPAVQFLEPGVEHLEHRDAVAVLGLVVEQQPQMGFVERPDAMPQIGQRQLVVVLQRKFVTGSHAVGVPVPAAR